MAENKNSKKKEEEVVMEKRFCTFCGKELKKEEECTCGGKEEVVSVNTDLLVSTGKGLLKTIIDVFKKPDTTISKEIKNKSNSTCVIFLIALAISFAFYLMALVPNMINSGSLYGNVISSSIDIPYFRLFIYGILVYGLMAIIPMFAAFVIAKITKNADFSFKKSFKLYVISDCPLIFGYLGMALIMLINVNLLSILGLIAFGIISVSCFFNFILGFLKETKIREDRKSYAITSLIIVWVVIEIIALLLIIGSAFSDVVKEVPNNYNNNHMYRW